MEFWGVEVKSGEPLEVVTGDNFILHLSQACLGEVKKDKGNESVCLYVKVADDKKFVLGTLSAEKFPQLSFDLVFEKEFELSHNWKNGSVYFSGYKITQPPMSDDDSGKPGSDTNTTKPLTQKAKPNSTEPKQKVKIVEPNKDDKPNEETDDSSNDESDSSDDDESSDDQDMTANGEDEESSDSDDENDGSDDEDDESDEEEETPKAEKGKKRSAEPAKKTPLPDKKPKLVTPQKTDGKKVGGHVATPHPSKKIVKTAANSDQKKDQPQKSFACASCNRSFGSDIALQSHNKAKHTTAK